MIGLDILMVIYTLWVLSLSKPLGNKHVITGIVMFAWLLALHLGLSNQSLFPQEISGIAFLMIIFAAVGAVGAVLLGIPAARQLLLSLNQRQLLLLQGIRVFFGAIFLMQASLDVLPRTFGILYGYTHIGRVLWIDQRLLGRYRHTRRTTSLVRQYLRSAGYSDCRQHPGVGFIAADRP